MGLLAWIRRERRWRREHIDAFSSATLKNSDGLTLFQHQALTAVAQFVRSDAFKSVAMAEESGLCLIAPIGVSGAELYIYPNEAAIFGVKPHAWFEEWDYRTPTELLAALVKECESRAAV